MESIFKSSPPKMGVVSVDGVGDKGFEEGGGSVVIGGSVTGGLGTVKVGFVVVVEVVSMKMGVGIGIVVKG